jgi:2-C-methyl-D-erythritol 2,4-cyclodiphosphate synthase
VTSGLRIGLGLDTHRLEPGRRCRLGGVVIESDVGPVGHSDGDAILHALCDAVLGAAGQSDLGTLFSDADAANKDRDSSEFCAEAHRRLDEAGFTVLSLDVVLEAERPKLIPHREAMRERIAELFGVAVDCVNVRGKTAEGLGAIGRGEAIRATAVALLRKD